MVVVDPKNVIRTERLLIRPLTMEDAEDIVLMRKDPEVMKNTSLLPSDDLQLTKDWIQGCHDKEDSWNFVVELLPSATNGPSDQSSSRVIGLVGAVRAPEVGYMFNRHYWGKGYATEALKGFMPMYWKHFSGGDNERYEYASALTDTDLVVSHNVLKKAGFKVFETRYGDFNNPVLGIRDTLVFRLDRLDAADVIDS